jgi:hypothetical protein
MLNDHVAALSLDQARTNDRVMAESLKMQDSMSRLERMVQEKLERALLLASITFVDRLELFISTSMEKTISSVVESSLKELVTERRLMARAQRNLRRRSRKDATAHLKGPNGRYNKTFALLTPLTSPDTLEEQMAIRYFSLNSYPATSRGVLRGHKAKARRHWKLQKRKLLKPCSTLFGLVMIKYGVGNLSGRTDSMPTPSLDDIYAIQVSFNFILRLWLAQKTSYIIGTWESSKLGMTLKIWYSIIPTTYYSFLCSILDLWPEIHLASGCRDVITVMQFFNTGSRNSI